MVKFNMVNALLRVVPHDGVYKGRVLGMHHYVAFEIRKVLESKDLARIDPWLSLYNEPNIIG